MDAEPDKLKSVITAHLAGLLGLGVGELLPDLPFSHYGLTSLHLIGLVQALEKHTGRRISPAAPWEHPTIAELAGHAAGAAPAPREGADPEVPRAPIEIAIVGMACRFPGAPDLEAYWNLCWNGTDAITEVPPSRWDVNAMFDPDASAPGKTYARWGGFLQQLDLFDADFFEISPREARHLDPRQRLMLELSWEALEDAGIPPRQLAGRRAGVFIATLTDDYARRVFGDPARIEVYSGTGTAHSMVANRLSYFYNLHGPSLTLDTACSGSLVALHLAAQSLRLRECSVALAGGVNILLNPESNIFFSRAGALARDGRCKTFDRRADGFVRSEGAGLVVLKRLEDARAEGDRIYAVISGSAVNQDGRTNGIMAPSKTAQRGVLREAYRNAGTAAGLVQYVEAHGTGTALGDPIEAEALGDILEEGRPAGLGCLVGSVKTNIGHTEAAAGIAGVIKTALAIHRRRLPGSLHFREANPLIPFERLPFKVASSSGDWPDRRRRLVAGVSGFGFGGTNAHVVLAEGPPPPPPAAETAANGPLLLSAQSPEALRELAARYAALLRQPGAAWPQIAAAATARRSPLRHRLAVVADGAETAAAALEGAARGDAPPGTASGTAPAMPGGLVLVYPGQGTHWAGMGRALLAEPPCAAVLEECDGLARRLAGLSLLEAMAEGGAANLEQTDVAQLAIFAVQAALTTLLRSRELTVSAVVGQSLGEAAAAHAAGALSLEDAFRVVWERSRLMRALQGAGRTAQIGLPLKAAEEFLQTWGEAAWVAGTSSPRSTVVAGEPAAIAEVLERLEGRGIFARRLNGVDIAFHGPAMEPLAEILERALAGIRPGAATIPFFSSVDAAYRHGRRLDAAYWAANLRRPFLFASAVAALIAEGASTFIEVSPHSVLGPAILEAGAELGRPVASVPLLRRGQDGRRTIAEACGQLFVRGFSLRPFGPGRGPALALPAYPWRREQYWLEVPGGRGAKAAGGHPLLGDRLRVAAAPQPQVWEIDLAAGTPHFLADHRVFGRVRFPGSGFVEMVLAAARGAGLAPVLLDLRFLRGLTVPSEGTVRVQLVLTPCGGGESSFEIHACSPTAEAAGFLCASGRIGRAAAAPAALLPDDAPGRFHSTLPPAAHYAAMRERGLDYGPRFEALREIRLGTGEALGRIELPAALQGEAPAYCLHPVILDALFQLAAPVLGEPGGTATYLPAGAERIEVFRQPGGSLSGHARLRTERGAAEIHRADLELFDEAGLVARVRGLELRSVEAAEPDPASWIYQLAWEALADAPPVPPAGPAAWAILGGGGGLADRLREIWEGRGDCVLRADHAGPEEARRLLQSLRGLRPRSPVRVVGLWALEEAAEAEELAARTLGILQALAAEEQAPRLWLLTRGGQAVGESPCPHESVAQAAVWGLGRLAMHEEHPALRGGLLDLDPGETDPAREAEAVATELERGDGEDQIAFRGGIRHRARLRRAVPSACGPARLDAGAAYLVTGGLGALGLESARWLAARGARRIVLATRGDWPARVQWRKLPAAHPRAEAVAAVRALEAVGCAVEVVSIDISDPLQVRAWRERRELEEQPVIRGIIHAAGVLRDARLLEATPEDVAPVFSAKVRGMRHLAAAFGDGLEFLVAYSSLAAIVPKVGQAVYAAANATLDAWTSRLRREGQRWVSIDWGPWSAGMMARGGHERFHASRGVFAMDPAACVSLLDAFVGGTSGQYVVAAVDWVLFRKSRATTPPVVAELGRGEAALPEPSAEEPGAFLRRLRQASPAERGPLLLSRLADVAAWVFRMPAAKIEPDRPLIAVGLDSMMATELKNRLEMGLGIRFPVVELLKGASLQDVAASALGQVEAETTGSDGEDPAELSRILAEIESMSPEEVRRELRQEVPPGS